MSIGAKWDSYNYRLAHRPKFAPTWSLWFKISGRRSRLPPIIFARLVRPMNAADSFHAKKLGGRLSSTEVWSYMKIGRFAFLGPPLGDLGATYDDHLRLIGKCIVDFLLVLIVLFSLGVTAEELRANIGWKSAISLQRGSVDPKFHIEGSPPTNHSSSQKTRINDLSHDIKISPKISISWVGCTNVTDRQTDGRRHECESRVQKFEEI